MTPEILSRSTRSDQFIAQLPPQTLAVLSGASAKLHCLQDVVWTRPELSHYRHLIYLVLGKAMELLISCYSLDLWRYLKGHCPAIFYEGVGEEGGGFCFLYLY